MGGDSPSSETHGLELIHSGGDVNAGAEAVDCVDSVPVEHAEVKYILYQFPVHSVKKWSHEIWKLCEKKGLEDWN